MSRDDFHRMKITRDPGKWLIEKCRRRRSVWHVYGPYDPDEGLQVTVEAEFRTGVQALAFVREQLAGGDA